MAKLYTPTTRGKSFSDAATFAGHYALEGTSGHYFLNPATGLLVKLCERKEHTPLRPRLYLMQRNDAGRFEYLTGLYPMTEPNTYRAELARRYYAVHVAPDGSALTIREV